MLRIGLHKDYTDKKTIPFWNIIFYFWIFHKMNISQFN
jgi:hypothetical protein